MFAEMQFLLQFFKDKMKTTNLHQNQSILKPKFLAVKHIFDDTYSLFNYRSLLTDIAVITTNGTQSNISS